ncbi:rRNA maturation RNase YbeY [Dokdonella fugitiva]|uniref:rRNA maturation RNase YbeY n=1 Tax=Dokdonella fugitiva TaxID=328517 RepID=UPI0015FDD3C9|nr:rRNA maturation RNase YbeY [Dokdonella fugitiva]MBA8884975.1 putative rRNA maturation factor [Dokdonella fugitiva]
MKAEARRRGATRSAPRAERESRICLWLRNEAGRKGVPVLRTFERWVAAIPELQQRRGWSELNILIVGRAAGRRYNRQFRGRDYATNVLSFPYEPAPGEHSGLLGDLVICAPVVAREAREQGKDARDHFAHMTIHGVLHLLGYDHEDERDADAMEALETCILASLGIDDPYR